jgi:hypothetical protein
VGKEDYVNKAMMMSYAPETRVKSKNTRALAAVAGEDTFSIDNSLHGW